MNEEFSAKLEEAIVQLKGSEAKAFIEGALKEGADPKELLQQGVITGLQKVGTLFEKGDYFLAELMMAGKIGEACIGLIKPHLPAGTGPKAGTVVIGAVEGDVHDIGYSLVASQLEMAGYEVHKLGVNLKSMVFIQKAQDLNADIIGLSAFLVTTIPNCAEVVKYLKDMGLRDKYKVIIGGTETSKEKAKELGCDGQADNAVEAVSLCNRLMADKNAA